MKIISHIKLSIFILQFFCLIIIGGDEFQHVFIVDNCCTAKFNIWPVTMFLYVNCANCKLQFYCCFITTLWFARPCWSESKYICNENVSYKLVKAWKDKFIETKLIMGQFNTIFLQSLLFLYYCTIPHLLDVSVCIVYFNYILNADI